jgi:hypothetical protein
VGYNIGTVHEERMSIRLAGAVARHSVGGNRRGLARRSFGLTPLSARRSRGLFSTAAKNTDAVNIVSAEGAKTRLGWLHRLAANLWFRRGLRAFRVGVVSFGLYKIGYVYPRARKNASFLKGCAVLPV